MTFQLPEFIDEFMDPSADPLCILLNREGSYDEAYQTAVFHRSGIQQIVTKCVIEQRPHEDDDHETEAEWTKRRAKERKLAAIVAAAQARSKRITTN